MIQNHGSILSDRQIRRLCEVPVGEMKFTDSRVFGVATERALPFYANEVNDLRNISMHLAQLHGARPEVVPQIQMYDEERLARLRASFQPMIEPFLSKQKKLGERDPTVDEMNLFNLMRTQGASPSTILERLKEKSPAVQSFRVDPLFGLQLLEKVVSSGLSSYGYDITCGDEFKVFTNINSTVIDPKNFDNKSFIDVKGNVCIIPPNSFALARTKEYFRIPRNVLTVCLGKSTYARCGIIVNVTPFEPEWEGYVTLEFSNTTPLPAKIYANEGCAQVLFFEGSEPCEVSYKDRDGKYMGQIAEPVPPKV